jgi:outer membrane protein assembly factor BamD (BamD/ComL family)
LVGESTSTLNHRELIQLTLLALLAVAAFIVTRSVAASNRDMNLRDAAQWYQRGLRQLGEGHVDGAIDAFRRHVENRDEPGYVLARAHARAHLLAIAEKDGDDGLSGCPFSSV